VSLNGFVDFSKSTANGSGTGALGTRTPRSAARQAHAHGPRTVLRAAHHGRQPGTQPSLDAGVKYQVGGSAPNRVLTVEWVHMDLAGVPASDLNFQVKLSEAGAIEFAYGTMTAGLGRIQLHGGINGLTMSATPTTAELLTQQTANTNSFGIAPQTGSRSCPRPAAI